MAKANPDAWLKPGVILGGLVPLAAIGWRAQRGELGANPIAEVLNQFGLLALVFLVASLAATPLKTLFAVTWGIRVRRILGLFAFFYGSLHMLVYVVLDRYGELGTLFEDIAKRPFVTVGFIAWALLVPLAWTSTNARIKQLGFARWKRLHQLSYVIALLAVIHFLWRVKKDASEPLLYGAVVVSLLALRAWTWQRDQRKKYAAD